MADLGSQPAYRVIEINGWHSPQQSCLVRGAVRWFSLLRNGYFADPDAWNIEPEDHEDVVVLMETREMADAAIEKAKRINTKRQG